MMSKYCFILYIVILLNNHASCEIKDLFFTYTIYAMFYYSLEALDTRHIFLHFVYIRSFFSLRFYLICLLVCSKTWTRTAGFLLNFILPVIFWIKFYSNIRKYSSMQLIASIYHGLSVIIIALFYLASYLIAPH